MQLPDIRRNLTPAELSQLRQDMVAVEGVLFRFMREEQGVRVYCAVQHERHPYTMALVPQPNNAYYRVVLQMGAGDRWVLTAGEPKGAMAARTIISKANCALRDTSISA